MQDDIRHILPNMFPQFYGIVTEKVVWKILYPPVLNIFIDVTFPIQTPCRNVLVALKLSSDDFQQSFHADVHAVVYPTVFVYQTTPCQTEKTTTITDKTKMRDIGED